MSGISSSIGLISGLDTGALISQLLQIDSKPKLLAQRRLIQLQGQQAALLDLNAKLTALRTASTSLRTGNIFNSAAVNSSNEAVLSATAQAGATPGTYSFLVDRVVSTQQFLSRGFVNRNAAAAGISTVTIESSKARLDADTSLATLNGGAGVQRGKVLVTDRTGASATIDLSKAVTVNDVLDAFNSNRTVNVRASVKDGRFVLTDRTAGTGSLSVQDTEGFTTATSLGVVGSVSGNQITGGLAYYLGDSTSVGSLNDGNGIRLNSAAGNATFDFTIKTRDGSTYQIDVGELFASDGTKTAGAAGTVGQIRQRILEQTGNKVGVGVSSDGRSLTLIDASTGGSDLEVIDISGAAEDLGIVGTSTAGTISGRRLLAGINSTLASNLRGGQGIGDGRFYGQTRDGASFDIDLSDAGSVADLVSKINSESAGKLTATLNAKGTGITLVDSTGGSQDLLVRGDAATALGIAAETGVQNSTINGSRLARKYVAESTPLSQLNSGQGVGIGTFTIQGPTAGQRAVIRVENGINTVGDLIKRINNANVGVKARINDDGNGIQLDKDPAVTTESVKISVSDTTGTVGRALNLVGEASGLGADNKINGSFRRVITIGSGETLDSAVSKINAARAGLTANVLADGSSSTPFRLRLSSTVAGSAGRLIIDSEGADLGLNQTARGDDSRVFFGSDDPARAILVSRSSNTIDGVIEGVSVQARSVSTTPVSLSITRDDASVVSSIKTFVSAYNTLYDRVNELTRFNKDTERKGVLLGDSVGSSLRADLQSIVTGRASGDTGQFRVLAQVGVSVGKDGQLSLDENRLRSALGNDASSVAQVFSAFVANTQPDRVQVLPGNSNITTRNTASTTYAKLGVLERLGQLADRYLATAGGLLTARTNNVGDLIGAQNSRITAFDQRLNDRRDKYQAQFAALETSLAKIRSQQSSLSSLSNLSFPSSR